MKTSKGAFFSLVLLVAVGIAQSQNDDNETCSYTCAVKEGPQSGDNWAVIMDNGISYYYLQSQNAFIVYNDHIKYTLIVDGNTGTATILNTINGYGIIINLKTGVSYIIRENLKNFDMYSLSDGDYQVITSIYQYISQYINLVTKQNVDTTQVGYFNIEEYLQNLSQTTDVKQWQIFEGQDQIAEQMEVDFQDIIDIVYSLYESKNYTVESGPSIFMVALTELYKTQDELLRNIGEFDTYVMQTMKGKIHPSIMQEYYRLITSDQDIEYITQQFKYLQWALLGIGTTYETWEEALQAYRDQMVVQTYVSSITITDSEGNIQNSYVAYNSMRNGTWIFRVMYTGNDYVQITASYNDKYLAVYDPKLPFALVYTESQNFGLINWETGAGLVINGLTGKAVYVRSGDNEIVDKFASGLLSDGFIAIAKLVIESGKIIENNENTFDVKKLLETISKKGEISQIISNEEDRASFQTDFAILIEEFKNDEYFTKYGFNSLVGFMLKNTQSTFFQGGFVEMINNMYSFQIASGRFYRDIYAGILYSIRQKWNAPVFKNVNILLDMVQKDNKPEDVLKFIEQFMALSWKIDVTSPKYFEDGTITN